MLLQRYPPLRYHRSGFPVEECGRVLPNGVPEMFEGGACAEEVAKAATLFDECKTRPLNMVGSKGLPSLEDRVFCAPLDTNRAVR